MYRINVLFEENSTGGHREFCFIIINLTVYCFTNYFKKPITENIINTLLRISWNFNFRFNIKEEEVMLDEINSFLNYWFGGHILKYDKKRINIK